VSVRQQALSTRAFDLDFETFREEMNAALIGASSRRAPTPMANMRSKKRS